MRRRVLVLVGLPVLLGLLTVGPAGAESGQRPIGRPLYLPLGDSVAADVGASARR